MARVLVIDNGGFSAKLGFAGSNDPALVLPNCTATPKKEPRRLVADETVGGAIKDYSQLVYTRPFDRGYLTNQQCLIDVWERGFSQLSVDPPSDLAGLLVTEPIFAPEALSAKLDEIVFEQFRFKSCFRTPAAPLSALQHRTESLGSPFAADGCCVVVDSGYSFTHALPLFDYHWLNYGARRVDVGGKLLTNYLKELISYRQLNVLDDTHVMEHAKRELCFVSTNFEAQLREAQLGVRRPENTLWRRYLLPNYQDITEGRVLPREDLKMDSGSAGQAGMEAEAAASAPKTKSAEPQSLCVNNERFVVPEVLFSPRDLGLEQGGVHEACAEAVGACAPEMQRSLFANVLLTGGNALLPGFEERFASELRSLAPDDTTVHVATAKDPLLGAWRGGSRFGSSPQFQELAVTKAQYEEHGHAICRRSFTVGLATSQT